MDALVPFAFAVLVVAQFTAVIAAVEWKQRNGQLQGGRLVVSPG